MAGKDNIADQLKAKFRDANVFNRHKNLGLKNNDQAKTYYVTNLTSKSLSAVGSLNDLMNRWWVAYIRPGSSTGAASAGVGDGNDDNTIGVAGESLPLLSITSAIGADQSAVVNYNYNDIGYEVQEMEYSLDGALSWYLVPTLPVELPTLSLVATSGTVTIPGLTNNVLYSLTLRVVSTSGNALIPASIPYPVRPNVSSAPDTPTSLVATPSNTSVSVAFTAGADGTSAITGYEYTINGGTTWDSAGSSAVSPVTISGLTASTSYTIALRAVNAVGASAASTSVTTTTTSSGFLGTGGTVVTTSGYKYHVFTSSGTLTVTNPGAVEYLVVGGGGSGGAGAGSISGGGGGAGGYLEGTSLSITATQTITVGGGGAAAAAGGTPGINGNVGGDSSIGTLIVAKGGGNGGSSSTAISTTGGSGGGGRSQTSVNTGAPGTVGQGNSGGNGVFTSATIHAAGGGGGAFTGSVTTSTTLSVAVTSTAVGNMTLTVPSTTGFSVGSVVTIDEGTASSERVSVTEILSSTTMKVCRPSFGDTPQTHAVGATVTATASGVGENGSVITNNANNMGGNGGLGTKPSWLTSGLAATLGIPASFAGGGGGGIAGSALGWAGWGVDGGGKGGGITNGLYGSIDGSPATANTGGGGGGGSRLTSTGTASGAGGSGIVIIRYPI